MANFRRPPIRGLMLGIGLLTLGGCAGGFDVDLRDVAGGFDTTDAARQATAPRPDPDDRGIISYPNFQVAVARRGDTVETVAARVGMDAGELARHNGIDRNVRLRPGEVIALPRGAADPAAGGAVAGRPTEDVDITTLAGDALDRADAEGRNVAAAAPDPAPVQTGPEPIQHQVARGETAYSISRLYRVSVRSLADWNGLGPDLTVREGQFLLIPIAREPERSATPVVAVTAPGAGSPTPEPPSASTPLPEPEPEPVAVAPAPEIAQPDARTEASATSQLLLPVTGSIIRGYQKGKTDGIDIAAAAGTAVRAADDGTVAAITRDTDGVPILVLRHADNLLTVYANIQDVKFEKGAKVSRGQTVAEVRDTNPSFLHFEVRQGFDSVDPEPYLN